MSWSKDEPGERDEPRAYHHGNLREALIRAALELIAKKGPAGFTFAEAARFAGVSPAAPYRHFRDRDELMAQVALRGFEQFEAALARAWDDGRPDAFAALDRLGRAYLEFARNQPALYSAMFEAGIPIGADPALARRERPRLRGVARRGRKDLRRHAVRRPTAGADGRAPYLVDGARNRGFVRTRRRRSAGVADVGGRTSGSRSAGLSARARRQSDADLRAAQKGLTTTPFDVNVIYIHNRGRAMPLVLMILGFLWWWPVGLLILGFLIARHRYGCWRRPIYAGNGPMSDWDCHMDRWEERLRSQDGAHAGKNGARARPDGTLPEPGRLVQLLLERQQRVRRLSPGDAETPRRGAARVQGVPRAAALRQGPRRVRSVHGRAPPAPRPKRAREPPPAEPRA